MADKREESDVGLEFDSVLNNELGQFGKFQIVNIVLLAIPAVVSGFMAGDYIFTAAKLPYRCAVPECDAVQPEYAPSWIQNAIPATSGGFEDCRRYANLTVNWNATAIDGVCPVNIFDNSTTVACDSYVYERTNTAVYDFGLECKEWLRALAGTLNSLGGMVCLPLAGFVSDYFGRRASVVIFSFNLALVGFIRSFSLNYTMYVTLQFLQTALGGGTYSAAYILATEIVGPRFRVPTSATMSSMFALGQVLLGMIAAAVPAWRTLSLILFTPVFLLVSYHWILSESYRWLLSKNKREEAKATLEKVARMNERQISDRTMEFLLTAIPNTVESTDKDKENFSLFRRIVRSRVLLQRCCTTPVWWVTTTFVYYGLSINSVSLSGNMYFNYIATAAIEIPGYWTAVLVLDRTGRKSTLFLSYMACAICCIAFAFIPDRFVGWSLFVYLLGKFSIAVVFTSVYLYTSELYPTRHRHSFLAFSSMIGRIGSVVAPLTPPLMVYWSGIPSMMFGIMAIVSALLVLTQPETVGKKLPDTLEDAEQIG